MHFVQTLSRQLTSLEATVAGFADSFTTKELTFIRATGDTLTAKHVNTHELCIDDVCVTRDQFKAMLAASATGATPPSDSGTGASGADTPPPVITINGDNPATIQVGAAYNDLGATITGPQADLNLGLKYFLNGKLVSNIVLDTSSVATDTIDYVVTDPSGNSATSTRTVIIEPATSSTTSPPDPSATTTTP